MLLLSSQKLGSTYTQDEKNPYADLRCPKNMKHFIRKPFPTETTNRTPIDSIKGRITVFIAPKPPYTKGHLTHKDSNQRQAIDTLYFSWNPNSGQHRQDPN